eukprot:scaffold8936_cov61-Phaeocystis_antarctica.AAC.4
MESCMCTNRPGFCSRNSKRSKPSMRKTLPSVSAERVSRWVLRGCSSAKTSASSAPCSKGWLSVIGSSSK